MVWCGVGAGDVVLLMMWYFEVYSSDGDYYVFIMLLAVLSRVGDVIMWCWKWWHWW